MSGTKPLIINGWTIYAHSLFLEQFEELSTQVESLRLTNPNNYQKKNATKRLAAIAQLAFEVIPQDPTHKKYRQGDTLGKEYKHWFRAKFFQQYRLFFRYHQSRKVIVFAWVNDENSKRSYGSRTDAYRVFQNMLANNYPPDDFDALLEEAKAEYNRLETAIDTEI